MITLARVLMAFINYLLASLINKDDLRDNTLVALDTGCHCLDLCCFVIHRNVKVHPGLYSLCALCIWQRALGPLHFNDRVPSS